MVARPISPAASAPGSDERPVGTPPPLPPARTVTAKPALVVLAVALVITLGGGLLALLGRGGAPASGPARRLPGVALAGVPAKGILQPVLHGGEPPADVLGSLAVPKGARRTGSSCSAGVELYDCRVQLSVGATPDDVVAFYEAELSHSRWSRQAVDATADGKGTEIIEKRPSSDGFYWEVGVVVDPVVPSVTPALGGAAETAPTSTVELRVLEIDDAD